MPKGLPFHVQNSKLSEWRLLVAMQTPSNKQITNHQLGQIVLNYFFFVFKRKLLCLANQILNRNKYHGQPVNIIVFGLNGGCLSKVTNNVKICRKEFYRFCEKKAFYWWLSINFKMSKSACNGRSYHGGKRTDATTKKGIHNFILNFRY